LPWLRDLSPAQRRREPRRRPSSPHRPQVVAPSQPRPPLYRMNRQRCMFRVSGFKSCCFLCGYRWSDPPRAPQRSSSARDHRRNRSWVIKWVSKPIKTRSRQPKGQSHPGPGLARAPVPEALTEERVAKQTSRGSLTPQPPGGHGNHHEASTDGALASVPVPACPRWLQVSWTDRLTWSSD
jgi:hypothetical protein